MKKALISPMEPVSTGYRVAEIATAEFPVAPPLFWIECEDDIDMSCSYYDVASKTIMTIVEPQQENGV